MRTPPAGISLAVRRVERTGRLSKRFIAAAAYVALAMLMSVSAGRTHDIYSHLKDNRGVPCCNNTDCRPARFRITTRGVEMLVRDIGSPSLATFFYTALRLGDTARQPGGIGAGTTIGTLPTP